MIFDAQKAIQGTTESKKLWHEANAKGDEQGKKKALEAANMYRKLLEDNGYGDIAKSLAEVDVAGAEAILKSFKDTSTINSKIDATFDSQVTNMNDMKKRYDYLEDYNVNHNPYESDIGKSILSQYQFQGKTASDNAVASGGASNGGNIDSYAAANANRQQLAFTNAGNQAVLNDFNTRVSNYKDILNNLGAYLQNQEKGMQTTIGIQQSEEQRQFENEETKKNNQVDRDVKTSEVTGTVPTSMKYADNEYFDADGNLINPHDHDYSLIIHNAKEALKTEKDPDEIAKLKKTIADAEEARVWKTTNMPEYSKYASTSVHSAPEETLSSKQKTEELETTKELAQAELDSLEKRNSADNANELAKIEAEKNANKELLEFQNAIELANSGEYSEKLLDDIMNNVNKKFAEALAEGAISEDGENENVITRVGDKYIVNKKWGGVVARYLVGTLKLNPDTVIDIMTSFYGYKEDSVMDFISKIHQYSFEPAYNPDIS